MDELKKIIYSFIFYLLSGVCVCVGGGGGFVCVGVWECLQGRCMGISAIPPNPPKLIKNTRW